MKLVITDEARDDLARIAEWIAGDDPRRAIKFIDDIEAHCERIAADPLIYPLLPGFESSRLRRAVHNNYLIFYRVDAAHVVVVHVSTGHVTTQRSCFPKSTGT